eukprot:TRINITY_DN68_c0_g1_i1.p2 TRINITY_DN68_c0_g1~~TRINITY_DN68_c0_g1_i1.p2  ORF type:complete len:182 (+),score=62.06 TRINITY_DN68_c0_g1_i1:239-784(+)
MGFGEEDIKTIKACAAHVAPLVPSVVAAVYVKLFSFDVTKKYFVHRNDGFEGDMGQLTLEKLTLEHDQIKFRKDMLSKYLVKLVTAEYDFAFIQYLDRVGKIHTNKMGNKKLQIDYLYVNALFGYVEDVLISAIMDLPVDNDTKKAALRAFNKILWIQNDLMVRHYLPDDGVTVEAADVPK